MLNHSMESRSYYTLPLLSTPGTDLSLKVQNLSAQPLSEDPMALHYLLSSVVLLHVKVMDARTTAQNDWSSPALRKDP
jgi:hypothetical protein